MQENNIQDNNAQDNTVAIAQGGERMGVPSMLMQDENACVKQQWTEPRADILRNYEIRIQFLSIGCMITVGCKSIPFSTTEEAMKELAEYVANPRDCIKKWNNIFDEYK